MPDPKRFCRWDLPPKTDKEWECRYCEFRDICSVEEVHSQRDNVAILPSSSAHLHSRRPPHPETGSGHDIGAEG